MITLFQAQSVSPADSLKQHGLQMVETIRNTAPDELIGKLGQEALQFGLKVLAAFLIYLIGAWIIRIIKKSMNKGFTRKKTDPTIVTFMNSLVSIGMWLLVIILSVSTLGINTTSLAAILAAGGMAVGMALSGTLQNFAGGLMILIFKPFKIGDFIEAQGFAGFVSEVNIVNTKLRTTDNREIVLPNGSLFNGNINNITAHPLRRVDQVVSVPYGTDAEKVRELVLGIISASPLFLDSSTEGADDPFVSIKELGQSSVDFVIRAWVKAPDYWAAWFYLNENIYRSLPENGISFPFPQLDVHIDK